MASAIFSYLHSLCPFSKRSTDDLNVSARLVGKLPIAEQTKQFVFALREPDSDAVVYILAAQSLSEQSALDAEQLIKKIQPKVVVAQVAPSALVDIQNEDMCLTDDQSSNVPTSSYEVLKQSFINKVHKEQYETFAGCKVLLEIFGVGFYGHFLSAKKAAAEVNSHFVLLESPYDSACASQNVDTNKTSAQSAGLQLQGSCLVPGNVNSAIYSNFRRFCLNDLQEIMVKSLTPSLNLLLSEANISETGPESVEPGPKLERGYQVPSFAKSFYPLLEDLHSIFISIPTLGKSLASAQKMLVDVNKGELVNTQLLAEVQNFRIAIEGLRIALNNAGRCPVDRGANGNSTKLDFSELPSEEKCHALFAQALRNQAKKFGSVVAILDASSLAGLRRHWNSTVPHEFLELANQCFSSYSDDVMEKQDDNAVESLERKKKILADKPVVAVGAGATAVLGASSLSKAFPASTLIKVATVKIPASIKFSLAHLQRVAAIGIGKIFGSSKVVYPWASGFGAKTSSWKVAASAEKIHAVTHGLVTSAQRTSLMAMRTSFYEIMMRRNARPVKLAPWASFGCSMVACAGLLMHGDGIECAAESIPSVPMIASLGRGLRSLHQAAEEVRQSNPTKIQEALHSLIHTFKWMKVNK